MIHKTTRPARKVVCSLSALALVVTGGLLFAGPLDPPAGPITSTYKTLSEVEPRIAINATNTPGDDDSIFKITQAGSYYLTADMNGLFSSGKMGIEIAASRVTLDLMGFEVRGGDGVAATGDDRTSITIHKGVVRNWGGDGAGIYTVGRDNRIEGNSCSYADRGILVESTGNIILRNNCSGNTINYEFAAHNRYGPVIDITAGGTPAVSGNSAADTTGTTHPWANFAH